MSYCFNPSCRQPQNPDKARFCITCGTKLLLKERYRVTQALGRGGCSKTLKALDRDRLEHPCVIKLFLLPPEQDPKATNLFHQEAMRLYELGEHDQIPELYAHFQQDNHLYLVQELIDGQNLAEELATSGTKGESQIRELLGDLLPVVQFIHEKGVIHRDIKPENIMRRRSDGKFVLIDFGGAKQATVKTIPDSGTMIGTLGYAPPEQLLSGTAYQASDLYALGATCIYLLTGIHPFNLYNPQEGYLDWQDSLPQNTKISPQLAAILERMVKNLLKDRYQSAQDVLKSLNLSAKFRPGQTRNSTSNPCPALVEHPITASLAVTPPTPRDIDYSRLQELLAAHQWREANQETRRKILEMVERQPEDYLDTDQENFVCKNLWNLSRLWAIYNHKRRCCR
ncbi:MAG: protein kinase [Coleofasciculaceae cyanobacterium]